MVSVRAFENRKGKDWEKSAYRCRNKLQVLELPELGDSIRAAPSLENCLVTTPVQVEGDDIRRCEDNDVDVEIRFSPVPVRVVTCQLQREEFRGANLPSLNSNRPGSSTVQAKRVPATEGSFDSSVRMRRWPSIFYLEVEDTPHFLLEQLVEHFREGCPSRVRVLLFLLHRYALVWSSSFDGEPGLSLGLLVGHGRDGQVGQGIAEATVGHSCDKLDNIDGLFVARGIEREVDDWVSW